MLIVGSCAMEFHKLLERKPVDKDWIMDWEHFQELLRSSWKGCRHWPLDPKTWRVDIPIDGGFVINEVEIAWPGSSGEAFLELSRNPFCASIEELLALKLSHRYLRNSPHFLKTMKDIKVLRKALGRELSPAYKEWLAFREKETYTYLHPSLKQDKKSFFSADGIDYKYSHDWIHTVVAVKEKPAYTLYATEEVYCSQEKFEACSYFDRILGVVEESMVLAIERSLVPFPGAKTAREAFLFALEKVCTSITSGWFREFAWENYDAAIEIFDAWSSDYWTKFQEAAKINPVFHSNEVKE